MHNPNSAQNIEAVACFSDKNYHFIRYLHPHPSRTLHQTLKINRSSEQIITIKTLDSQQLIQQCFSAFLGVVEVQGSKFLLFCEQCKRASAVEGMEVFQIYTLSFVSYAAEQEMRKNPQRKKIYQKLRNYYIILKHGFYFSHQYKLTRSLSMQHHEQPALNFTWNRNFLEAFDKGQISPSWKTPIIQGFVSSFEIFYQGAKVRYMLVTRRSTEKGGPRYFDRGINDEGNVANYCQTQQIVKVDGYIFSDLQVRGSLPIFFQQVGLYTKTKINRGFELTHQAFQKHIKKMAKEHKRIFMINLLTMGKRGEKMLTKSVEDHIRQEKADQVRYLYYDFHQKVEGGKYEAVDEAVRALKPLKANFSFYCYNSLQHKVVSEQEAVVRTNCLDCLDRTNFFQAKMAIITLQNIFEQLGVSNIDLLEEMRENQHNNFIKKFRHIWADNGDAVSYHYTGTGSTHTDITRDGKRGLLGNFKHKYKSIARFYNQNFWDFYKMRISNQILGRSIVIHQEDPHKMLEERQGEYITIDNINIYIFTWKAPKHIPKSLGNLQSNSDIIVISIQDLNQSEKWLALLTEAVDSQKYMKVEMQYKHNNLLIIYAKHALKQRISKVQQCSIKFRSYYNAFMSNKSANIMRMQVDSTKLVFVGCQLEKGRQFYQNRIRNLKEIHECAFQVEDVGLKRSESILFNDIIFLIGNMNTNVDVGLKHQFGKFFHQKQGQFIPLVKKMTSTDQFQKIRMNLLQYRQYEEHEIKFMPTYRYTNGTFDPDYSGWVDRIWYSSDSHIECLQYNSIDQLRHSHVPVFGRFKVEVKRVDEEIQEKIKASILEKAGEMEVVGQEGDQSDEEEERILI